MVGSCTLWAVLHHGLGGNELMDEVISSKPISEIRRERKAILVQLLRARLQTGQEYEAVASQMKPISPPLYSDESFENEDVIRLVMTQVRAAASTDIIYSDKQQAAMNEFRTRMSKADPAYLESFESDRRDIDDLYGKTASLVKQWLDATSDLYDFAAANHKTITLKANQLIFSDPKIKFSFEDKKGRSADLLIKLRVAEKEGTERQRNALPDVSFSKLGLRVN